MSDTTQDLVIERRAGNARGVPMAASTRLYAGQLVATNTDGNAVNCTDAASIVFAGVAVAEVDNTDGSAGDLDMTVYTAGELLLTATGLAAGDEGKPVYVVDNQTVGTGDSSVTQFVFVGFITEVVSATQAWVRIQPGKLKPAVVTIEIAGTSSAALDLSAIAAYLGGTNLYVLRVLTMQAYTTATGDAASPCRRAITTHYTLSGGVITTVGNQTALTLVISAAVMVVA